MAPTVADARFSSFCLGNDVSGSIRSPAVTVATLNISHGRATALNQMLVSRRRTLENLDAIAALLDRQPLDIVALQEADAWARWSGNFDHIQHLLNGTNLICGAHGRHAHSWLYSYGTALLSAARPRHAMSIDFEPSPPTLNKGFVRADFDWNTGERIVPLTVISVHLDFSRKTVRDGQVREMIASLRKLDSELIVMGDMNSEWSAAASNVRQLVEALELRAFDPASTSLGTYKSSAGPRLDWILVSSNLEFLNYRIIPDIVSDHLAVLAEITFVED